MCIIRLKRLKTNSKLISCPFFQPLQGFKTLEGVDCPEILFSMQAIQYNKSIPEYQEHTSLVTAIAVLGIANLDHLLAKEVYYSPEKTEQLKAN